MNQKNLARRQEQKKEKRKKDFPPIAALIPENNLFDCGWDMPDVRACEHHFIFGRTNLVADPCASILGYELTVRPRHELRAAWGFMKARRQCQQV